MAKTYTGYKAWTTLEQYNTYTGLATGLEKSNTPDQPEYVAPILSGECTGPVPEEDPTVQFYAHITAYGARDWEVTLRDSATYGAGSTLSPPISFSIPLSWKADNGTSVVTMTETVVIPTSAVSARTTTPTINDIAECINQTVTSATNGSYTVTYVFDPLVTACTP